MRTARVAAVAAVVIAITNALPLAASAAAESTDLFVDRGNAQCSDAGVGSQAIPYCTISAAAKAVLPGQTVHVAYGQYPERVELTRSGEPGKPITFAGDREHLPAAGTAGMERVFTLSGVHDVTLSGFTMVDSPQEAAVVTGSSRVVLDRMWVSGRIRVTGGGADVTVSRSRVSTSGDAVVVEQGAARAVVTTNVLEVGTGRGVSVTDAPGAVVTANTVQEWCGPAVELAGHSGGATVENNVLAVTPSGDCGPGGRPALSVSGDSVAGTKADYNVVGGRTSPAYRWAGTSYADVAAFRATGQGAHDASASQESWEENPEGSVMVDSADASAPGMLDTDVRGNARVDDPLVANSGTGVGYADRGAVERQDPLRAWVHAEMSTEPGKPMDVVITGAVDSPWSPATGTVDFGDGSPTVPAVFPLTHTYQRGRFRVTVTATDGLGHTVSAGATAAVALPAEIGPNLMLTHGPAGTGPDDNSLRVAASPQGTVSPWPVTEYAYDFGDGTPVVGRTDTGWFTHDYATPGTYTVTETVKDDHGRQGSTTRQITVASVYKALQPTRVLDTRIALGAPQAQVGPGGTLKLQVTGRGGVPADKRVTAVLLNLTATGASADTHVTAFPGGTAKPNASNLNVRAGQDVANAVMVPVGADGTVSLYNNDGRVDLVADVQGYYTTDASGAAYQVGQIMPVRAFDTRNGSGKVGPGSTVKVKVVGPGLLPEGSKVAVLNVTATEGTDDSHVTVTPDGAARSTSSLNFTAGRTVANQVTVPIAPDGTVALYNHSGSVHLVVDVQEYYIDRSTGGFPVQPTAPTRLLDTRNGIGGGTRLGPNGSVRVKVAGAGGVPQGGSVMAAIVNLTATGATEETWLAAYPAGSSVPATSNLNLTPGGTVPNLAMVPVNSDGYIEVHNHSGSVDVIVDLEGYVP